MKIYLAQDGYEEQMNIRLYINDGQKILSQCFEDVRDVFIETDKYPKPSLVIILDESVHTYPFMQESTILCHSDFIEIYIPQERDK